MSRVLDDRSAHCAGSPTDTTCGAPYAVCVTGTAGGERDGQNAACPPQPTQFLSCGEHCLIDGVGLGEFLVERMFATCRQRQRNRSVSGEVADQFEVIVAERRLVRVACDGDHTEHPSRPRSAA